MATCERPNLGQIAVMSKDAKGGCLQGREMRSTPDFTLNDGCRERRGSLAPKPEFNRSSFGEASRFAHTQPVERRW